MAKEKKKVAVLVSGGGTNLQAILDAEKSGSIKSGEVSVVVSSKDGAYALERAKAHNVEGIVIPRKDAAQILEDAKKFQEADEQKLEAAKNGTANRAWVEKTLAAKEFEIIDGVYEP